VVYPAFAIGRIAGVVTKSLFEAESHLYYEVIGDRSTVWVQVDEGAARGLRRLTRRDELERQPVLDLLDRTAGHA
jgi:RNA polymerase-interacting CarD/CdnL/TRCF family regulator